MIEGNLLVSNGKKITVFKPQQSLNNCSMLKKVEILVVEYENGKLVKEYLSHFFVLQDSVTNPAESK